MITWWLLGFCVCCLDEVVPEYLADEVCDGEYCEVGGYTYCGVEVVGVAEL